MLIDWFTVGAQALNFVILVWLMRRFLYAPVLAAIDAREKKIAAELAGAAAKAADAEKRKDEFQHKNEEFDRERGALLTKATDDANSERGRLLDEARRSADALGEKRRDSLRKEARDLNSAIGGRAQEEVFAIARKALADLAGANLEERMVELFIRRLREMDAQARGALTVAFKEGSDSVLVRSAFDLPAGPRAALQDALNRTFSAEVRVRFESAPDLIGGLDLTVGGQRMGWSIADYLASLEKAVNDLLNSKEATEAKADAPKADGKAAPSPKAEPKADEKPEPTPKAEPKADEKPEPTPEAQPQSKEAPAPPAPPSHAGNP